VLSNSDSNSYIYCSAIKQWQKFLHLPVMLSNSDSHSYLNGDKIKHLVMTVQEDNNDREQL